MLKDIDDYSLQEDTCHIFMPKPFVFEDMIIPSSTKVYLPGCQLYIPFVKGLELEDACPIYMCVHMCEQFFNYPTTNWGIRVIPSDARCPFFGGRCTGARLIRRGKDTGKSINIKNQLISGLSNPQKTK